jgi:hypothetical protein
VKYVILIHCNPAAWDALTDAQHREIGRRHLALTEDLAASGELVVSEALADPSLARTVPAVEPGPLVSDGPYAEAKEYLAGFYLLECASLDEAVRHAERLPYGPHYRIEVRPVMNLRAVLEQA